MKSSEPKVALVTGSNRGIGLEVCRQLLAKGFDVVLTARDAKSGKAALEGLGGGKHLHFCELDVTSDASVARCRDFVAEKFGRLDVLVNNAGIFVDEGPEIDTVRQSMETNTYGPLRMTRAFAPLLKKADGARVINVSSGMGQLGDMNGGYTGYRLSKTALNAVTRILSEELSEQGTSVNSICPGWVKTDMGGAGAELPVEKGADTITWLASEAKHSLTGMFFRSREPIPW